MIPLCLMAKSAKFGNFRPFSCPRNIWASHPDREFDEIKVVNVPSGFLERNPESRTEELEKRSPVEFLAICFWHFNCNESFRAHRSRFITRRGLDDPRFKRESKTAVRPKTVSAVERIEMTKPNAIANIRASGDSRISRIENGEQHEKQVW